MKSLALLLTLSYSTFTMAASEKVYCNLAKRFIPGGSPKHMIFEVDLNNDKKNDFFISDGEVSIFGADFKVFMTAPGSLQYAGNVYLHPNAVQLVPGKDPKKEKAILVYDREDTEKGELVKYELSQGEYKKATSEKIAGKDVLKKLTPEKIKTTTIECK